MVIHTLADSGRQETPARDGSKLLPSSAGEQRALQPGQQTDQWSDIDKQQRITEALRD